MTQVSVDLIFINELVEHFRENETDRFGRRRERTRPGTDAIGCSINGFCLAGGDGIDDVRTIDVERWLRSLTLARRQKSGKLSTSCSITQSAGSLRSEIQFRVPCGVQVFGKVKSESEIPKF